MSILSKIENGVKTLAHKAEDALKLFVKDEPKIEAIAATAIATSAPFVIAIAGVVTADPAVSAEAAVIVAAIQSKLAAAQVIITTVGSASSAKTILQSVVDELSDLLALVDIKNPALTSKISDDVNKISAGLQVIIAAL